MRAAFFSFFFFFFFFFFSAGCLLPGLSAAPPGSATPANPNTDVPCALDSDCGGGPAALCDEVAGFCTVVDVCEGTGCGGLPVHPRDVCPDAGEQCLWTGAEAGCTAPRPVASCSLLLPPVARDGDRVDVGVFSVDDVGAFVSVSRFTVTARCAGQSGACEQIVDAGCGPHVLPVLAPTAQQRVVVVDAQESWQEQPSPSTASSS